MYELASKHKRQGLYVVI